MIGTRTLLRLALNPGFASASVIVHSGDDSAHYHLSLTVVNGITLPHTRWTLTPDLDEAESVFASLCHWLGMALIENLEQWDADVDAMPSDDPEASYVKCWELCENL